MKRSEQEIQSLKDKYPSFPEAYIPRTKKKKKNPTNQLTSDVIDFVKSLGGHGVRINSQGTYSEALGKFIKSGATKGVSDIIACHKGRLICIEIKRGRDQMRPDQVKFQLEIQKAGGFYLIASDLESFKVRYQSIIENLER